MKRATGGTADRPITLSSDSDEAELQEWHPTNSLVGLARHLVPLLASSPTSP